MRVRLNVSPMVSYSEPSYPRRDVALADPSLLAAHRPNRWKKVALSAAFALLTGAGCSDVEDNGKAIDPGDNAPPIEAFQSSAEKKASSSLIAPLFLHGRGYASFGCDAVTPPAFLSEAEACELISSVFREHGLSFRSDDTEKIPLTVPWREPIDDKIFTDTEEKNRVVSYTFPTGIEYKNQVIDFAFDGIDDEKRIAYEYVSSLDVVTLRPSSDCNGLFDTYFFKVAAARLMYLLEGKAQHAVGIFYDPTVDFYRKMVEDPELVALEKEMNSLDRTDPDYDHKYKQVKEAHSRTWEAVMKKHYNDPLAESKELLRLQVLDFIEWLKAQGIIQ